MLWGTPSMGRRVAIATASLLALGLSASVPALAMSAPVARDSVKAAGHLPLRACGTLTNASDTTSGADVEAVSLSCSSAAAVLFRWFDSTAPRGWRIYEAPQPSEIGDAEPPSAPGSGDFILAGPSHRWILVGYLAGGGPHDLGTQLGCGETYIAPVNLSCSSVESLFTAHNNAVRAPWRCAELHERRGSAPQYRYGQVCALGGKLFLLGKGNSPP